MLTGTFRHFVGISLYEDGFEHFPSFGIDGMSDVFIAVSYTHLPARQTFLVLGLSRSGCAAAEFLLERKAKVFIYDDVPGDSVEKAAKLLTEKGAERVEKDRLSRMHEICDALVLSPGIPIDLSLIHI